MPVAVVVAVVLQLVEVLAALAVEAQAVIRHQKTAQVARQTLAAVGAAQVL